MVASISLNAFLKLVVREKLDKLRKDRLSGIHKPLPFVSLRKCGFSGLMISNRLIAFWLVTREDSVHHTAVRSQRWDTSDRTQFRISAKYRGEIRSSETIEQLAAVATGTAIESERIFVEIV